MTETPKFSSVILVWSPLWTDHTRGTTRKPETLSHSLLRLSPYYLTKRVIYFSLNPQRSPVRLSPKPYCTRPWSGVGRRVVTGVWNSLVEGIVPRHLGSKGPIGVPNVDTGVSLVKVKVFTNPNRYLIQDWYRLTEDPPPYNLFGVFSPT